MSHYQGKSNNQDPANNKEQLLTAFQHELLQKSLQNDLPEQYRQRIEIMLLADEGKSQAQICQALGCSQGTARYWITLAQAGQAHKWNAFPIGRPKTVNDQYLERLKELVRHSPRDYGYPFGRWTGEWLSKHLAKELGVEEITGQHINRLLKKMGLSTRQKASNYNDMNNLNLTGKHILINDINDLQSKNVSDFSGFLLINLALEKY